MEDAVLCLSISPYKSMAIVYYCMYTVQYSIVYNMTPPPQKTPPLVTRATFVDRFSSNAQNRLKKDKIEFHFLNFFFKPSLP